jgi:hypothetical protein
LEKQDEQDEYQHANCEYLNHEDEALSPQAARGRFVLLRLFVDIQGNVEI